MDNLLEQDFSCNITAFPHCVRELADYAEYIIRLFAAIDIHFHNQVILFDKAVCCRIGSHHDLKLTDFNKFADLKAVHMDSIGAAVVLATKTCPPTRNMKHAIYGIITCACLVAASVIDFMCATSVQKVDTKDQIVPLRIEPAPNIN